jgi:hypothetical protein
MVRLPFMGTLHIKDFPDDLQRQIKVAAAQRDESMKALIIRACEAELAKLGRGKG